MAQRLNHDEIAAWVVRCNPRVWDLERYWHDHTGAPIRSWSVGDNYRSRLMQAGDRILLWVGGQSRRYERGFWGAGLVTGQVDHVSGDAEPGTTSYWSDARVAQQHRHFVNVRITPLLDTPITDQALRDIGVDDIEVQRLPQGVSPSWLTSHQLEAVDSIAASQPDPAMALAQSGGGRFAEMTENRRVELAAMAAVTEYYEAAGWIVHDVSKDKVGWDLTCSRGRRTARVEVKGVRSENPIAFLTAKRVEGCSRRSGVVSRRRHQRPGESGRH